VTLVLRHSLAHLVARIATLAAGIVAIPLVTLTLGSEALGLVGVYATLQAILSLFDLGLPVAANHRLAVMVGQNAAAVQQAAFVRTLETLFWALVAVFLVVGFGLRGLLADSWLNVAVLPRATVDSALILMIAATAIRFPVAFYANVLFAYDRHFFPNAVTAASAVLRVVVSLVALVGFNVGIAGFFVIHLIVSIAEVGLLAGGVWRQQGHRLISPKFSMLHDIRAMAGGLTLVSLTAVALSQIDKIILSKLLSLGDFGLYSAGYTMAAGLVALSYPVGNAVFPQLSRSLDAKDGAAARIIQAASELTILILVPLGCVLIMQAEPLLRLLFLVKTMPDALASILPLMMLGAVAQGFVTLPHLFQVAAGRVSTVVWINVGLLIPYGAGILVATAKGGVLGAAAAFAALNVVRLLLHWIVLTSNRQTRSIWLPAIGMALASVAAGLILADVSTMIGIADSGVAIIALLSVPALAVAAILIMPVSRERLFAFYRAGTLGSRSKS
jgi:O-antigen/teichoic acid export membrane protein